MKNPSVNGGYSSFVQLHLEISGQRIELGQICPGKIFLREPVSLPAGEAEVVMNVDDFEDRWQVYLPDGISANSLEARTVPVAHASS